MDKTNLKNTYKEKLCLSRNIKEIQEKQDTLYDNTMEFLSILQLSRKESEYMGLSYSVIRQKKSMLKNQHRHNK